MRPFGPSMLLYVFWEADRRRDPSNVVGGGVKIVEDALQAAGYMRGDGWGDVLHFTAFVLEAKYNPERTTGVNVCIFPATEGIAYRGLALSWLNAVESRST
jgi:hypothetical protein